jgi:amino acid adenylation domain-containing protein/non-ribosomal peptide synthase protein (TIGR01720 family)
VANVNLVDDTGYDIDNMDTVWHRSNLSKSQLLIWMGQKLHPDVPLYNTVLIFHISGKIDPTAFRMAFQALIDRSDTFRTVIDEHNGVPRQRVIPDVPYSIELLDFSISMNPETVFRNWLDQRSKFCFNLTEILFDSALIRMAADQYIWYLNQHHLMTDVWSSTLVYRRMAELYGMALSGCLAEASMGPAFQNYVEYEHAFSQSRQYVKAVEHWRQRLTQSFEPVRLYGRMPAAKLTHTKRVSYDLGPEDSQRLRSLAANKEMWAITPEFSLFIIFATLLFAYLYRVSGARRLAIGTPNHNRSTEIFKKTIGLFMEIYPLQLEIAEDESFLSLLHKVREESYTLLRYAQPGASSPEGHNAYNVVLNYINTSFQDFNGLPMESEWIHPGYGDSHHSLRFQIHDLDASGSFTLFFDFHCDVMPEEQHHWAVQHFLKLLEGFLDDPAQPIDRVDILADHERERLLIETRQIPSDYPSDRTIMNLFDAQVEHAPEAIALVCGEQQLTYRELNKKANRLAHHLISFGIGPEQFVGLCVPRSVELLVGVLGILKAGGAYLPLDPNYPKERLAFILRECQTSVLVTQKNLLETLSVHNASVVCADSDLPEIGEDENPVYATTAKNLAYMIYTSGSTGNPKGVMIEHRNVINLVFGLHERIYSKYDKKLNVALVAPYVFDASVQQIFAALLLGHCLHIVPDETRMDGEQLIRFYHHYQIDVSDGTPSHIRMMVESIRSGTPNLGVKHFIIGGETLPHTIVEKFFNDSKISTPLITNVYGPAECCVDSTSYDVTSDRLKLLGSSIPIGSPLPSVQIYILNPENKIQPTGVPGEICISGNGVGRGYLGRDKETSDKFIDNPFNPGTKLYRTGDLGRYLANGDVDFIGRTDSQVKIRGYRIELEEIEAQLRKYRAKNPLLTIESKKNESKSGESEGILRCERCLLGSDYPGIQFDRLGVCNVCREYDGYKPHVNRFFRPFEEFEKLLGRAKQENPSEYDCLLLYSGGKDSSYVLYRLVEMGMKVLAYTFDNGFISSAAIENIKRQTSMLKVDCIVSKTGRMNEIFVESLNSDQTVCSGCFKSLTTISTKIAQKKRINVVITGLSRGQIFDTKLKKLYQQGIYDVDEIEEKLAIFRRIYHANEDWTSKLLNVDLSNVAFENIHFVDFFRYDSRTVDEIRTYLKRKDKYWRQPKDTGFCSSNCMMNDIGIYVHKKSIGYHNYASPLSWDIRLGAKTRDEGLKEIENEIDVRNVTKVLDQIGFFVKQIEDCVVLDKIDMNGDRYLCTYFVSNQKLTVSELHEYLSRTLPDYMIPARFVQIDKIPLTNSGKIDRRALPEPDQKRPELEGVYVPARTSTEKILADIWSQVLRIEKVGSHDNFIELGGDSILCIQIVARANQAGLRLKPRQIFEHQTIAELAAVAGEASCIEAEQGLVTGQAALTPIQHWFFNQELAEPNHWNLNVLLSVPADLDINALERAIKSLAQHHDALRLQYSQHPTGWQQVIGEAEIPFGLQNEDLSSQAETEYDKRIEQVRADLQSTPNLETGDLLRAVYFNLGDVRPGRLLIMIHHLAVDGLSWGILIEDLETAYDQICQGQSISLPAKTTSFKQWSTELTTYARSAKLRSELDFWLNLVEKPVTVLPLDFRGTSEMPTHASSNTFSAALSVDATQALIQNVPSVYNTQMNDVLLTALIQVLSDWTGGDCFGVDMEGHGREDIIADVDISRTVGWFTTIFPVVLTLEQNLNPGAALSRIKEQLRRIPDHGIGFGLLRYLAQNTNARSLRKFSADILFNYLGQLERMVPQSSLFQLAQPLIGSFGNQNKRSHRFNVNTYILNEQLHVDWVYSTEQYHANTVQNLADAYVRSVETIVDHCASAEAGGYTPSDFPLADLNEDKLSKLANVLEAIDSE